MLISLADLTLGYERHPAVHHVTVGIERGEQVALVGPNGGGKSTLLRGLVGELPPLSGQVTWSEPAIRTAYLPQRHLIDRDFPLLVWQFAAFGLWRERGVLGRLREQDRRRIDDALVRVGLEGQSSQTIAALSGGQFQRLLFARLLLQDAELMLLDEPFAGVDEATTTELLDLLTDLNRQGVTILAVMHELQRVAQHFPRCWLLARRLVAAGPTSAVLTPAHLAEAWATPLVVDAQAPVCQGQTLAGAVP